MLLPFSMQTGLSLFKSPFFANWKLHLIGSDAWRQGKTIRRATNPSFFFCNISYSMFSQNWHDPQPYQHQQQRWKWKVFGIMSLAEEWSAGPSLLRKRDWSTAYSPVFFARTWALTEEIESLARILMRMATKKVKKGENPPSPDSFYGQLHIYWEMEDPCARFSLELLARCRFFFFSSCFPASWIDAAADSPPTTNS